jgi:hypothetical protein
MEGSQQQDVSTSRSCSQLLLLGIVVVFAAAAMQAQESAADASDSARVLALETLWNQAEVDKDAAALDHLLADKFVYTDIDGTLQTKSEFLESVRKPPEHITNIGNDSMLTRVYDSTVIVTGTYHEKGTLNGKPYSHHGRFTDTWVRHGSSWFCIASQATLIQKSVE